MKNAVVVHGWGGNSQGNWFPWLKAELEKQGFKVSVPDFPNAQNPVLSEWLHYFNKSVTVDAETILIGHSLGVAFILRFLEYLSLHSENEIPRLPSGARNDKKKIKAAFLVAAFDRSLGIPEIENFINTSFNWEKIKSSCDRFTVINSDNDPYIPLQIGKDLAKNLDTELIIEHNAGHIDNPDGLLGYPKLLNFIVRV